MTGERRMQIGAGFLLGAVVLVLVDGVLPQSVAVVVGSLLIGIGLMLLRPRRCPHRSTRLVQGRIGMFAYCAEKECTDCGKRLPR